MDNSQIIERILKSALEVHQNLSTDELVQMAVNSGEGQIASNGALAADTGEFTGRSPKDKFTVYDEKTKDTVWWGDVNFKFDTDKFDKLLEKVLLHLENKKLYIRDAKACADPAYSLNIKVVTETAYQNLFAKNLFIRPSTDEKLETEWLIIAAPSFKASPETDGTRQHNFSIINFTRKMILIGGSGYTGEIKKGIFTVLNYVLPQERKVLSMHCSANIGDKGDTAIFFGLSGTGKTTLSADPKRKLIGDDEHGWAGNSVFNFEGGCYAKCIDLTEEKEPTIWKAIKHGALAENVRFKSGTNEIDYSNISVTENTRVAYPLEHIENMAVPSIGTSPRNIFFLTCDAFGVLPPISKLTAEQAMYHFISGYTSKVAGTEAGITEPQSTFSACFGQAFLPLHPAKYAELLGQHLKQNPDIHVWMVNTGWSGGSYGVGSRMKLSYTRAMLNAALNGDLDKIGFEKHPVFGFQMPLECPDVPAEILNPRNTWSDKTAYDLKVNELAEKFNRNFLKFEEGTGDNIKQAGPKSQMSA